MCIPGIFACLSVCLSSYFSNICLSMDPFCFFVSYPSKKSPSCQDRKRFCSGDRQTVTQEPRKTVKGDDARSTRKTVPWPTYKSAGKSKEYVSPGVFELKILVTMGTQVLRVTILSSCEIELRPPDRDNGKENWAKFKQRPQTRRYKTKYGS